MLTDQLRKHSVNLTGHVCRVTTDVKASLLVLKQVINLS